MPTIANVPRKLGRAPEKLEQPKGFIQIIHTTQQAGSVHQGLGLRAQSGGKEVHSLTSLIPDLPVGRALLPVFDSDPASADGLGRPSYDRVTTLVFCLPFDFFEFFAPFDPQ